MLQVIAVEDTVRAGGPAWCVLSASSQPTSASSAALNRGAAPPPPHILLGPGTAIHVSHFSVLLTQIDQSDTIPHSAGFRSSYSQSQVRPRVDRCMRVDSCGG
jgi:hypothetical protein